MFEHNIAGFPADQRGRIEAILASELHKLALTRPPAGLLICREWMANTAVDEVVCFGPDGSISHHRFFEWDGLRETVAALLARADWREAAAGFAA
jgi:hypothetical protein